MVHGKKYKIIAAALVLLITICFALGVMYNIYQKNTAHVYQALESASPRKSKMLDASLEELNELSKLRLMDGESRVALYSNISMLYALKQDYCKMIETAVTAIYYAEKTGMGLYAAWNYVNLAETFMLLYDYDTAEALIKKALSYEIEDPADERWLKETAYIYMAEIKEMSGEYSAARKYLEESKHYIVESAYDYEEMLIKRQVILANSYWDEGDRQAAGTILENIPSMSTDKDILLISNVAVPLAEIKSMLEIADGELSQGIEMCDDVLSLQDSYGLYAAKLRYLKRIIPLLEGSDKTLYEKYTALQEESYDKVMSENSRLTADYIFSVYGNQYAKYQDKSARSMVYMVSTAAFMFILALAALLLQSRKQGYTDPLTKAYNRRYFDKAYKKCLKEKVEFSVIMIDVDCFKAVNDSYGHDFGDLVLSRICREFNENKAKRSKLFRMGGEEFCILYQCESIDKAVAFAEKLRMAVERMKWENGYMVTISAGVAFSGQGGDLYKLADKNLYASKASGRNRITYITEEGEACENGNQETGLNADEG